MMVLISIGVVVAVLEAYSSQNNIADRYINKHIKLSQAVNGILAVCITQAIAWSAMVGITAIGVMALSHGGTSIEWCMISGTASVFDIGSVHTWSGNGVIIITLLTGVLAAFGTGALVTTTERRVPQEIVGQVAESAWSS